ncbi:MAG: hypothetical protein ACK56F_28900, partial [bacterium]
LTLRSTVRALEDRPQLTPQRRQEHWVQVFVQAQEASQHELTGILLHAMVEAAQQCRRQHRGLVGRHPRDVVRRCQEILRPRRRNEQPARLAKLRQLSLLGPQRFRHARRVHWARAACRH